METPALDMPAVAKKKKAMPKTIIPKTKEPYEMSLIERLNAKNGTNMNQSKSLFEGNPNLTDSQIRSKKLGPGHKRTPKDTTMFDELNRMAA